MKALVLAISIVLLAGSLIKGQDLATTLPDAITTFHHDCTILHHNLTVEEVTNGFNCRGVISVLSCSGMCHSELIPHAFENRDEATNDPFINGCTCCRIVSPVRRTVVVPMTCREGDSVRFSYNTTRRATTATDCACAPCNA